MTLCVVHQDHEADEGWLVCRRAWGRLAGSLRQIPGLVDELSGLGFVQRDRRDPKVVYPADHKQAGDWVPHFDPIASGFPAGPLNGSRAGPRVSGSPGRTTPIRIDPTDLLGRPRHASLAVAARSRWPEDQVGYLAAATVLDFWVRDWADIRGERPPDLSDGERSPVPILCSWLLDRLDWACTSHFALDEFARDVQELSSTLYGLAGKGPARPKAMEAACPGGKDPCGYATLFQPYPDANIECAIPECGCVLTPDEYEEMVKDMRQEIKAQDVLAALNGGLPVDLEALRIAVVIAAEDERYVPGELMVLVSGREPFGLRRRPQKDAVIWQEFGELEKARIRQAEVLKVKTIEHAE